MHVHARVLAQQYGQLYCVAMEVQQFYSIRDYVPIVLNQ